MRNKLLTLFLAAGLLATTLAGAAETSQADRVEIGQQAPGFSLASSDGGTYTLDELRGEKDLVLIFFRGSW